MKLEKGEFLTNKSTNKNRLINVLNWDNYQCEEENQQADQQSSNKQLTTIKNDKELKELCMIDCMGTAKEIASASESSHDRIFESLNKNVPTYCYVEGIPLGDAFIYEIYAMLAKQFPGSARSRGC